MTSRGPMPSDDLDAGWDAADDELSPETRSFASDELVAQTTSRAKTKPRPPETLPPMAGDASLRATVPPPMFEGDYVAEMMKQAAEHGADGSHYRPPLATLMEIDPLRFDQPEERAHPPSGDAPHEAPSIELVEETLDVSPELLINTMPPPAHGGVDELDSLPFDEVLESISRRPSDVGFPDARPPEASEVKLQAGLRLGQAPPPMKLLDEAIHDRVTLPGEPRASIADRPNDERAKMLRRLEAKDYMGALILAESLTAVDPTDLEVQKCGEECRARLTAMYMNKLGERTHVLRRVLQPDEIQRMTLDHRAGFLLSCIDGTSSLDELMDLSGMPPLDTVRLLYELVQEGVVEVEPPPPRSSQR